MPIQPILRDDNGFPLSDRGSELITKRYANVGTQGQAVSFDVDVKAAVIHIEGTNVKATLTGPGAESEAINWTTDGLTFPVIPVVKEANNPIATVAASSGTINVSVLAWR